MTAIVIGNDAGCAHPLLMECANIAIQLGQGGVAVLLVLLVGDVLGT
jgi:hypothetical protein